MPNLIAAADQNAATTLLRDAETTLGTLTKGPSGASLDPFATRFSASISFSGGSVNLSPPNIIEIANCNLNYNVNLTFSVDLNDIIPQIWRPRPPFFS